MRKRKGKSPNWEPVQTGRKRRTRKRKGKSPNWEPVRCPRKKTPFSGRKTADKMEKDLRKRY